MPTTGGVDFEIVRELPIEMKLVEIQIENGDRRWIVVYGANIDGQTIGSPIVQPLLGANKTPEDALRLAAQRLNAFGF